MIYNTMYISTFKLHSINHYDNFNFLLHVYTCTYIYMTRTFRYNKLFYIKN